MPSRTKSAPGRESPSSKGARQDPSRGHLPTPPPFSVRPPRPLPRPAVPPEPLEVLLGGFAQGLGCRSEGREGESRHHTTVGAPEEQEVWSHRFYGVALGQPSRCIFRCLFTSFVRWSARSHPPKFNLHSSLWK